MASSHITPPPSAGVTRRHFLQIAGAGVGVLGFPAVLRSASPGNKLNIAVIGCGGRGGSNYKEMLGENIVALCDVNEQNLLEAAKKAPGAKQFRDFRKMYDALRDSEFDAVVVSTTEHTHAFATLPALKRKKHVYCEKPITRDVHEARIITEAARAAGVATQMGTQIHATSNYRRVVEHIQGGAIGTVREVHVWVNRTWGWQSPEDAKVYDRVSTQERPKEADPVPPWLDWDLWIGPAPFRPFNNVYIPGNKWYRWWDFGNGTMSDLGSHYNDLPFWALNLDAPLSIEASGPPPHPEIAPATMSAAYQYGARGSRPAVKLVWYQGQMKPPAWNENPTIRKWPDGHLFIGDKGMLLSNYSKFVLLPEKQYEGFTPPPQSIPESLGHHKEWLHACKTGAPTTCHFGYSGPLTEANHLGNVAFRAGKKIEWKSKTMRIPNAPDAERFLRREYRKGWKLG